MIAIVLIVVLVIYKGVVLFHDRSVMEFIAPTYQMSHDPETKAEVEDYLGVVFPDSIEWKQCYIENAWDGVYIFCAKFTIPENDFK